LFATIAALGSAYPARNGIGVKNAKLQRRWNSDQFVTRNRPFTIRRIEVNRCPALEFTILRAIRTGTVR